jgi:hypothetical protein
MLTSYNDDFKIPFRNYVLDDLEVNSLIDQRFHGQQLASLYNPAFPCAVFYQDAGLVKNLGIIKQFSLVIRAYSADTYDEAYSVYEAIAERLGGISGPITINIDTDNKVIIRPTSTTTETYENEPRIYGVGSRFGVTWIS